MNKNNHKKIHNTQDNSQNNKKNLDLDLELDENTANTVDFESKAQEYLLGWQRAQADYQNLKKSNAEEKAQLSHYVKAEVLKELFPILNNYSLACMHIPAATKNEAWVQGFMHLEAQFKKFFEDLGVVKIEVLGKEFDVHTMEAVEARDSAYVESDTVIEELRPGWKLGDEIISHAQVVVAK